VNGLSKLYYGGLPAKSPARTKLPKASHGFVGALHGIKLSGKSPIPLDTPSAQEGVTDAYENYIDAVHIGSKGGYGVRKAKYKIGTNHKIDIKFSAKKLDGYIFYNSGNGDFLNVKLEKDGSVTAECNNGGGYFSVSSRSFRSLCDGNVHELQLVKKGKTLKLTIDGNTESVTTKKSSSSADTSAPVYIAGRPAKKGVGTFYGCVYEVKLNGKAVNFSDLSFVGAAKRGCRSA
jgi:hypothetical protein